MVSYICDTCWYNESILSCFYLGGYESFTSLSLWLCSFCSRILSKLRSILFECMQYNFFAPDYTYLRCFGFGLELCLSKHFLSYL